MELDQNKTPIQLFNDWMTDACRTEANDPDAASLATASKDGQPNVRIVLVKHIDETGFSFFTNGLSQKGKELDENPRAALCFHWKSLLRQVRVRGIVQNVSSEVSDAYFATRHPVSQRGAHASLQSQSLESRDALLQRMDSITTQYPDDALIPRPAHWHGYTLAPHEIEFWQQGDNRLHDRFLFTRIGDGWKVERLYP